MIKTKHLTVTYPDGTNAVDDFTFEIQKGENVALIGANGAGKTSLMMALMDVIESKGEKNDVRSQAGMVFQNPDDQLFMSSIYDDIAFGLRNGGMDEDEIEKRVDMVIEELAISELKNKTALKLSGGEKRMAALATVLVMEPSVLIFDEPTAFLDPSARRRLIRVLKDMPQAKLIATHDMTFAAEICERAVLIKNGKLIADGPSEILLWDNQLMEKCGVESIPVYTGGAR